MSEKQTPHLKLVENEPIDDGTAGIDALIDGKPIPAETPKDDFDMSKVANIAQTSIFDKIREHKVAAAVVLGVAAGASIETGQAIHNASQHQAEASNATAAYNTAQARAETIKNEALDPANPTNVAAIFQTGPQTTLYEAADTALHDQTAFKKADAGEKAFMEATVLESAKDLGTYNNGDQFALKNDTIDNKATFITTKGDNALSAPEQGTPNNN